MKRSQMEKQVLLALSGELSSARRKNLEAWIETSAEAQAYRRDVLSLTAASRQHLADADPGRACVAALLGRARQPGWGRLIPFPQPTFALRALAGVAALVVLVASWFVLFPAPPAPSDSFEHLHTIVAMMSGGDSFIGNGVSMADDDRMLVLARQLLIMEGFVEESNGEEMELLREGPAPTTLQWRNTRGSPQEKYG